MDEKFFKNVSLSDRLKAPEYFIGKDCNFNGYNVRSFYNNLKKKII